MRFSQGHSKSAGYSVKTRGETIVASSGPRNKNLIDVSARILLEYGVVRKNFVFSRLARRQARVIWYHLVQLYAWLYVHTHTATVCIHLCVYTHMCTRIHVAVLTSIFILVLVTHVHTTDCTKFSILEYCVRSCTSRYDIYMYCSLD